MSMFLGAPGLHARVFQLLRQHCSALSCDDGTSVLVFRAGVFQLAVVSCGDICTPRRVTSFLNSNSVLVLNDQRVLGVALPLFVAMCAGIELHSAGWAQVQTTIVSQILDAEQVASAARRERLTSSIVATAAVVEVIDIADDDHDYADIGEHVVCVEPKQFSDNYESLSPNELAGDPAHADARAVSCSSLTEHLHILA